MGTVHDLELGGTRFGSEGWNALYSVPWGYLTVTISASSNSYHQQISAQF
ncbi:ShlB/FhaC/HecB family hemolysin secretion/activation protein [Pandoraea sp. NPDC090278]